MGLLVWLPLMGDIHNQGLLNITTSAYGTLTYENGKLGNAVRIGEASGGTVSKGIEIDSNLIDELGTEYSCSVWVKPTGNHQNYEGCIISSGDWNNATWSFGLNQTNTKVSVMQRGYNNYIDCEVPANTWTHLVSTAKNGVAKLYKNGEYIGSKNIANPQLVSSQNFTRIGNASYTNYFTFNGLIQDVRLYNEELDPCQIKHLSQGLVLHYPLSRIGGDNLAQDSYKMEHEFGRNNLYVSKRRGGDIVRVRADGFSEVVTSGISFGGLSFCSNQLNLNSGDIITFSCMIYTDGTNKSVIFYPMMFNSSGTRDTSTKMQISVNGGTYINGNNSNTAAYSGITPRLYYVTMIWNDDVKAIIDNGGRIELTIQAVGTWAANNYVALFAPKIEYGDKPTPWIPNPADTLYSTMGLDNNIEYDVSGYGNNGTKKGIITYSSDTPKYFTCSYFNGDNTSIQTPNFTTMINNDIPFTINLWFKKESLGTDSYETLYGGPSGFEMDTRSGSATTLSLYMASTRGGNAFSPFNLNEWYMVTMVSDRTNEYYYVNGDLKKTITAKTMPSGNYFIGAWSVYTSQNYKGLMSDFRIYTTALSADDILELYHTPVSITNSGVLITQGELSEV